MTNTKVKICGINSFEALQACIESEADFVGLNFYPPSPRSVSVSFAQELASETPAHVQIIGVFVDPTLEELDHVLSEVAVDLIQLHGKESPDFCHIVRDEYNLPIVKAISISNKDDLAACQQYAPFVDAFLFDSKPPKNVAALPGGNALSFDWSILKDADIPRPWFLAGGLNAGNIAQAIRESGAHGVDTASGVEDRPGFKSPDKIREFLAAARN